MFKYDFLLQYSIANTEFKGRITKIEKSSFTTCNQTTGIDKYDQEYYDSSEKYHGSNGTYVHNFNTVYGVDLYLTIYGDKQENDQRVKLDIRNSILENKGLTRISIKKMNEINENTNPPAMLGRIE